jgi:endoglucanase
MNWPRNWLMTRRSVLSLFGRSAGAAAFASPLSATFAAGSSPAALGDNGKSPVGPAIDQAGYRIEDKKVATVIVDNSSAGNSDNQRFELISEVDGKSVFRGTLSGAVDDAASGERVAQADFSAFRTRGRYRLIAQGQKSEPFAIESTVYREPLRLAMRSYYGQRCGCAVDLGGGYAHPACHAKGAFHATSGRGGTLPNHGGWHDAGDYGRYVVNSGISTGTLLWAWEIYPQALRNLALAIPESGGKLPDYLAEIRWNLEWMLEMQDEDGGVWQKQTSEAFCPFVMPQDDHLTSYVIGTGSSPYKSTCATADLASVMAIAARCYQEFDAVFAAQCLAASRRAWTWASANPDVKYYNPKGITTGAYEDIHCNDEILWASAELWRTTGDALYESAYLSAAEALPPEHTISAPSWSNVAMMGHWTYVMANRPASRLAASGFTNAKGTTPEQIKKRILDATAQAAQDRLARFRASRYGNTLELTDYVWGSNGLAANQSLLLLIAIHLKADTQGDLLSGAQLQEAAMGNLHYLLGRNCFAVSWVTQVGSNAFQYPHHRPSASDGMAAPWPGLLSGGPKAIPADSTADRLPKMAPMRMWIDDQNAYSVNEVAINWNAPLVFLLAAANLSI